jgi:hypothetical protein
VNSTGESGQAVAGEDDPAEERGIKNEEQQNKKDDRADKAELRAGTTTTQGYLPRGKKNNKVEEHDDFSVLSFKQYIVADPFADLTEDELTEKADKAEEYASKMAAERYARKMKTAREDRAKNSPSNSPSKSNWKSA